MFESYQYVGEEFTITGLGTFTCQGIKQSLLGTEKYYVYTSKITSNSFKKEDKQLSYFEILETDISTNTTYRNELWFDFYGEIPKTESISTDKSTGIKLNANSELLPENTTLVVNVIKDGDTYNKTKTILSNTVSNMYVYDISLKSDGVQIQPNGKVKISIPVPANIDTSKLAIYRIAENGEKTEYKATVEIVDNTKYATFETDHFSTYVLAERGVAPTTNNKTETPKNEDKKEDNTQATGKLPNTGVGIGLTLSIIASIVILAFVYRKYKYYNDI